MLSFLKGLLGKNEVLSLIKKITQKLMLSGIGQWCLDLARLTLTGRCYTGDREIIPCVGLAKHTSPNDEWSQRPVPAYCPQCGHKKLNKVKFLILRE